MLTLEQVNLQLKLDKCRVAIEARGKKLSLRATLPPKPGHVGKHRQQRIALDIGHTQAGIKKANLEARKLADEMDRGAFRWENWLNPDASIEKPELTCQEWIEQFRLHLFSTKLTGTDEEKDYQWRQQFFTRGLNQLPLDEPLSITLLRLIAQRSKPNSAARERNVRALSSLAAFVGIEGDLKSLRGSYGPGKTQPRDIPTNSEIEAVIDAISDSRWQWAFGLIAAYGLRGHELFFSEVDMQDGVPVCLVRKSKTGPRTVYPALAEWVQHWRLIETRTPRTSLVSLSRLGMKVSKKWRLVSGVSWTPYDLRHAYAIRVHNQGCPVATAAAWMGHSPTMHLNTYNKWISQKQHAETWKSLQS